MLLFHLTLRWKFLNWENFWKPVLHLLKTPKTVFSAVLNYTLENYFMFPDKHLCAYHIPPEDYRINIIVKFPKKIDPKIEIQRPPSAYHLMRLEYFS